MARPRPPPQASPEIGEGAFPPLPQAGPKGEGQDARSDGVGVRAGDVPLQPCSSAFCTARQ